MLTRLPVLRLRPRPTPVSPGWALTFPPLVLCRTKLWSGFILTKRRRAWGRGGVWLLEPAHRVTPVQWAQMWTRAAAGPKVAAVGGGDVQLLHYSVVVRLWDGYSQVSEEARHAGVPHQHSDTWVTCDRKEAPTVGRCMWWQGLISERAPPLLPCPTSVATPTARPGPYLLRSGSHGDNTASPGTRWWLRAPGWFTMSREQTICLWGGTVTEWSNSTTQTPSQPRACPHRKVQSPWQQHGSGTPAGLFYLCSLDYCAQVVEAVHLSPGQNSASRKELSIQRVRGTRVQEITQTAPGHHWTSWNTEPSCSTWHVTAHSYILPNWTGPTATGNRGYRWLVVAYNAQWNRLNTHTQTCVHMQLRHFRTSVTWTRTNLLQFSI